MLHIPRVIKFRAIESKIVIARLGGGENGTLFNGCRVLVLEDEKSSEDWLPNKVTLPKTHELHTYILLCHVYFPVIKKYFWWILLEKMGMA